MCATVDGDVPRSVVFEDEQFLAVLDRHPAAPGHVLLIVKEHAHYLDDLAPSVGHDLLATAGRLRRALLASDVPTMDVKMFLSEAEPGYGQPPHVHMHVFPRNDPNFPGNDHNAPAADAIGSGEALDQTALRIRRAVDATEPVPPSTPESPGHRSIFWRDARDPDRRQPR